jgi:hypothetical protein
MEKSLVWLRSMSESQWSIYFTNNWTAETLKRGLEFDNFKPRLKSGIFKCISWLNRSYFLVVMIKFSEEGSQAYLVVP